MSPEKDLSRHVQASAPSASPVEAIERLDRSVDRLVDKTKELAHVLGLSLAALEAALPFVQARGELPGGPARRAAAAYKVEASIAQARRLVR